MAQPILILGIVLGVPLFWVALMALTARIGGWSQLAEHYAARDEYNGPRWRFESGRFRNRTRYASCLTFGANPRGLYISTLFLFRPGHPALFIPWSEVTMRRTTYFFFPFTELKFRRGPAHGLLVRERLGQHLAAAAGLPWPLPENTD